MYPFEEIEAHYRDTWQKTGAWDVDSASGGSMVLEMLPYPSGEPHVGHLRCYAIGDTMAHYRRRCGQRVLHPMGYDSFGLPAENHAVETGTPPQVSTQASIDSFQSQFERWGISIDWSKTLTTHTPEYYRWSQYIFLKLFERGLAYRAAAPVNWCPGCQTVLANEQVVDGTCERCEAAVQMQHLTQWFLKTSAYARELEQGLDALDWPERVKTMQRNWIGKSHGANVRFHCPTLDEHFEVFTTRPDTLYGVSFLALAPEHAAVTRLRDDQEVRDYITKTRGAAHAERGQEKSGIDLGVTVVHPLTGEEIPLFVADYVLMDYGTGAVMGVPAHDARDFAFARRYGMAVRQVIEADSLPHPDPGTLMDSGEYTGMSSEQAAQAISAALNAAGQGESLTRYRLRDWLVSRQRYWGCPIPIIHCEHCGAVPVPETELPIVLPTIEDYAPKGESPLAAASEWVNVSCPNCGADAKRETDTLDTFFDSSWYFLRYVDPHNDQEPFSRDLVNKWFPVDTYIGGIEHAILHLLYARFFTKAFADMDMVGFREPFQGLYSQGMITLGGRKMGKSKGNAVSPTPLVERYGIDTLRCFVLYVGPGDRAADWAPNIDKAEAAPAGQFKFLSRFHALATAAARLDVADKLTEITPVLRAAHRCVAKVTERIEGHSFHTAIAAIIEFSHDAEAALDGARNDPAAAAAFVESMQMVASVLFVFAPHLGASVYQELTGERVWDAPWPEADPELLADAEMTIMVQVGGKVRAKLVLPHNADEETIQEAALAHEDVQKWTADKTIERVIMVPGRMVSLVVK